MEMGAVNDGPAGMMFRKSSEIRDYNGKENGWSPLHPDLDFTSLLTNKGGLMHQPLTEPTASFDVFSAAFLLPNVGAPFLIGLAVGYFAKKMLRVALLLGGAAVILFFLSEYYGITHINDQNLQDATRAATDFAQQSGCFLIDRLSQITCKGGSAVVGFFAGLRIG